MGTQALLLLSAQAPHPQPPEKRTRAQRAPASPLRCPRCREHRGTVGCGFPSCCSHRTCSAIRTSHVTWGRPVSRRRDYTPERIIGAPTTKGPGVKGLGGEVQASCPVEAAFERSLEKQKNQGLEDQAGRAFRAEGTAGPRVGGRKAPRMCRVRH